VVAGALTVLAASGSAVGATYHFEGSTGVHGVALTTQSATGVDVHFEMSSFAMEPVDVAGATYQKIAMPQVFLPGDAGRPDLPGMGRFIALPEGSTPVVEIVASRVERYPGIEVAPAPELPLESDDGPLVYEWDPAVYERDAFYPESPVRLSEVGQMRGVDVVTLGITPFQYNPITKELVVYTELEVRVSFEGGLGVFGEERLRNRFWEPILENHLLNYASLPAASRTGSMLPPPGDGSRTGCEYIIICPDHPDFIAWADTLKAWRQLEGILTEVYTTTDIGGTSSYAIDQFLFDAYDTWDPAPAAFLILGDYPGSGDLDSGITAGIWDGYCASDNLYADVDADDLPDMFHGRITARNADELETMIGKMLDYERQPYTDPDFYDHPVMAGGWQTERWFILCTEICYGHQSLVLGKNPVREYAIYSGSPTTWSTNQNTWMLLDYFGPAGLGYIPSTPAHLTDWGANATRLNNDLNAGAYLLLHRDHGGETGWGEPDYDIGDLGGLHNEMYPFVFSINCLTGKYNWGSECFTEAFHRMGYGALGVVAASETSYSFVNDTFIFGMFDGMWPEFMPTYGPYEPETRFHTELRPALGMANGKYFLHASNWPYNSNSKDVTYHLFHSHGDTFLRMYSEVPQHLNVDHAMVCFIGQPTFTIQADEGAVIALTVDGEIVAVADATGAQQEIGITPQTQPGMLRVTVTKANYYRYDVEVPITATGSYLIFDDCVVEDDTGDQDGILDAGETAGLVVTLENVGTNPTTGISAVLTSTDPLVNITTAAGSYPDIPAGGTGTCLEPFVIELPGDVPDGHQLHFTLVATANEGQWDCNFTLPVQAPVLEAVRLSIDDTPPGGNGNGRADPGETLLVTLVFDNTGSSDTPDLEGVLSCEHPDVVIHVADGTSGPVPAGATGMMGGFEVELTASCPSPMTLVYQADITASNGFGAVLDYEMGVGPWYDDCEDDLGWALGVPGDNASTGVWVRLDPTGTHAGSHQVQPEDDHTPDPGTKCFVTGNAASGYIANYADVDDGKTTLRSPVFDGTDAISATLTYWRWYTNEFGMNPGEDTWKVEVTNDGVSWTTLEDTQASNNSWVEHTFELGQYVAFTDHLQVQFVASDYYGDSLVEAAVDDIIFDIVYQPTASVGPVNVEAVRAANGIVSVSPNPFNPSTAITYQVGDASMVRLSIYDVHGRLVRTLVDGTVEAGSHTVLFDGKNAAGASLASSVYFLRLETPAIMQVRQVTLVK
jgi:hypothetical protein